MDALTWKRPLLLRQIIHCDSVHLEGGSVINIGPGKTKHIGRGCLADASMQEDEPCLLLRNEGTASMCVHMLLYTQRHAGLYALCVHIAYTHADT